MKNLTQTLAEVRQRIKKAGSKGLNEQNTKAALIEPVLRALGWDTEDVEEVAREYKTKTRDKPVDYGLLLMRTPRLFVEAKALGKGLNDRKWANQIMGYAAVAGVEWIVLTNGLEYRIYNAHALVHVDEKLFRTITIDSDDAIVQATLELLAKDRMQENRLEVFWRAEFVDRQVKTALDTIFSGDGDLLVVNYIKGKADSLTVDEIRSSLRRCRPTFDYPVPTDVSQLPGGKKRVKPTGKGQVTHKAGDVSLVDLIEAGILTPPVALERMYKGQFLKARINADGTVQFGKDSFNSPSMAGGMAKASVIGFKPDGNPPATNGWSFWRYKGVDGKAVALDVARQQFGTEGAQAAG